MTQISERLLVQAHLDAKQPNPLTDEQQAEYRAAIAAELKAQNAVLVAHYYCDPVIQALAATPLLDLGLRLGEGSGAAVAVPLLRLACALHNEMATFAEAQVSTRL